MGLLSQYIVLKSCWRSLIGYYTFRASDKPTLENLPTKQLIC